MSTTALVATNAMPVWAGSYSVSSEAELSNAVADANASGDAASTITMTGSFATPIAFPSVSSGKSITIETGTNTLTFSASPQISVASNASLTLSGQIAGAGTSLFKDGEGELVLNGTASGIARIQIHAGHILINNGSEIEFGTTGGGLGHLFITNGNNEVASLTISGVGTRLVAAGTDSTNLSSALNTRSTLTIENGAYYGTGGDITVHTISFRQGIATINVTGAGSTLEANDFGSSHGATFINVQDGGLVNLSGNTTFGGSLSAALVNARVTAEVSGGSRWQSNVINMYLGSLSLLDGGVMAGTTVNIATSTAGAVPSFNVLVSGAGSELSGTAVNLGTTGTGILTIADHGKVVVNGGASPLVMGGADPDSNAILNIGGAAGAAPAVAGTLEATAVQLDAKATVNFNHTDSAYDFAPLLSGAGTINHLGSGKTILAGDSSAFAGTTNVQSGTLTVNGILGGDLNVLAGGRLQGTGEVASTTNFGIIAPGNSIGTLLVNGDYAGNGGILEIETALSGTGSPADRLVITGNVTGTTTIQAINLGGTGALTGSTSTDGVSIVQVGGTSSASAFRLAGGYAAAGPYRYQLVAFDPASSAAGQADPLLGGPPFWDYRLQSLVDASGNPVPVPQIAAYQGMPSGALRYGSEQLDSLHDRLGDIRHAAELRAANDMRDPTGEFFLRQNHSWADVGGDKAAGYDQETWYTQFGGTLVGWDVGDLGATFRAGAAISIGGSDLDVDDSTASVDLKGTSLALTSTYQGAQGWYIDGVLQGTRYSVDVATAERGLVGSPSGWGAGASLSGGYPLDLGDRLLVEPQAQLVYQHVRFDGFTDVDNIAVDLQGGESLRGRFGGRAQKTFASSGSEGATLWSPFLSANLLHEFLNGGSVNASGASFQSDNGGTSVELSSGLNLQIGPYAAMFAQINYEKGLTDAAADAWGGTAGLRMNF